MTAHLSLNNAAQMVFIPYFVAENFIQLLQKMSESRGMMFIVK
jgi:hypothetical protein